MASGGKRTGAGRPKGSTSSKSAIERAGLKHLITKARTSGETPLEVLLRVMRSSTDIAVQVDCAKAAAPYVHPRLNNIEHSGSEDHPMVFNIITGVPRLEDDEGPVLIEHAGTEH